MKVFIDGILAVGMRHYDNDDLAVGARYILQHSCSNRRDFNAVAAIGSEGKKKASLKRDAARLLSKWMDSKDLSVNTDIGFLIKLPSVWYGATLQHMLLL